MKLILIFTFFFIFIKKKGFYESLFILPNFIYKNCSSLPIKPIYNISYLNSAEILTNNWLLIREEAVKINYLYKSINDDLFFENLVKNKYEWKKFYLKWHSNCNKRAMKFCPNTCKLIDALQDVKIAMFSLLLPGAKIHPHRGLYRGYIRFHLGLDTPNNPNCFIIIDNVKYYWKNGKGILFDDMYEHYVQNNTKYPRLILFCDIIRPMNSFGEALNSYISSFILPYTTREN